MSSLANVTILYHSFKKSIFYNSILIFNTIFNSLITQTFPLYFILFKIHFPSPFIALVSILVLQYFPLLIIDISLVLLFNLLLSFTLMAFSFPIIVSLSLPRSLTSLTWFGVEFYKFQINLGITSFESNINCHDVMLHINCAFLSA